MAQLIDQILNSGLFAQSAYSASIATKDSLGRDITTTYLTGINLPESATWNDVSTAVQTNSAQWAEGTSVDTVPVAVISPLVTGFSGEGAYLGIESTALNLSSYLPVSAIEYRKWGANNYVSAISGNPISAMRAATAGNALTASIASRAEKDSNYNTITSYYQPKLTISGDAGTITSINGSAVGASIPEGWELVAGEGIEIVDDAENNQTTISVTAAGGNPDVESYVQTNSASIDDAVSTYQTNSGSYITQETDWTNTITAASSYAYSEAVAQIPAPFDPSYMSGAIDQNASDIQYISGVAITALPGDLVSTGDLNTVSSTLSGAIDYVSGQIPVIPDMSANEWNGTYTDVSTNSSTWNTVTDKLDTTAFSNVSGSFLTAVNIPESANWNDATTAYQTNSATYMSEPNLEYNAVNEISAYNGSAIAQYGAEKQWLVHDGTLCHLSNSAQYALGVNLSALQRLMGIDETVLYDRQGQYDANLSSISVSEPLSSFDYVRFYDSKGGVIEKHFPSTDESTQYLRFAHYSQTLLWAAIWKVNESNYIEITGNIGSLTNCLSGVVTGTPTNAGAGSPYNRWIIPMKIVGIGRKA